MKLFFMGFMMCLLLGVIGTGAYLAGQGKLSLNNSKRSPEEVGTQTTTPAPAEALVGNDKDEHGCIGSAGYTWCEAKQQCLRPWEENCDDDATIINAVRTAIVAKRGQSAETLNYTVSKVEGWFAKGGASGEGGGGMWFAAKVNGTWQLVWDGNGIILCTDLADYPNFPTTMIPECFNNQTQKLVKR